MYAALGRADDAKNDVELRSDRAGVGGGRGREGETGGEVAEARRRSGCVCYNPRVCYQGRVCRIGAKTMGVAKRT